MKECPICKSSMNLLFKYDYFSSSAGNKLPSRGTIPLEGSISFPPVSPGVYVIYWKCPNCGYCISEKITGNVGSQ
jgi:uncharacterized protein (DUF2225 family)